MSGKIYFVSTPIGNMGDITDRAIKTIKEVNFLLCEDTRVTAKLLAFIGVKKELLSFNKDNEASKASGVIKRVKMGESCALVSDAGMPCIQDPGERLVSLCYKEDVDITIIPGANAALCALAISGLSTQRFSFEGFLSTNKKARYEHLEEVKNQRQTLIFYESKHKIKNNLEDMRKILGNREISIVKEITKIYESAVKTDIEGAINFFKNNEAKGEYVLVVEGSKKSQKIADITLEDAVLMAENLTKKGYSKSDASKIISLETRINKSDIYKGLIKK